MCAAVRHYTIEARSRSGQRVHAGVLTSNISRILRMLEDTATHHGGCSPEKVEALIAKRCAVLRDYQEHHQDPNRDASTTTSSAYDSEVDLVIRQMVVGMHNLGENPIELDLSQVWRCDVPPVQREIVGNYEIILVGSILSCLINALRVVHENLLDTDPLYKNEVKEVYGFFMRLESVRLSPFFFSRTSHLPDGSQIDGMFKIGGIEPDHILSAISLFEGTFSAEDSLRVCTTSAEYMEAIAAILRDIDENTSTAATGKDVFLHQDTINRSAYTPVKATENDNSNICNYCCENVADVSQSEHCAHVSFCLHCFDRWWISKRASSTATAVTCPLCRVEIKHISLLDIGNRPPPGVPRRAATTGKNSQKKKKKKNTSSRGRRGKKR